MAIIIGFGLDDPIDIKGPTVAVINETRLLADADQEGQFEDGNGRGQEKGGAPGEERGPG